MNIDNINSISDTSQAANYILLNTLYYRNTPSVTKGRVI